MSTGVVPFGLDPACICRGLGFAAVHNIASVLIPNVPRSVKVTFREPLDEPGLAGLTREETAILAGVLTGLAAFLFLALPILCCLCPLCLCCGACPCCGKKKREEMEYAKQMAKINDRRSYTDEESLGSWKSWEKMGDTEDIYEVDMKLPRVWVDSLRGLPDDQFDAKLREMEERGWGGSDMKQSEMYIRESQEDGAMSAGLSGGGTPGSMNRSNAVVSGGVDQSGGQITEWEMTRHMTMVGGGGGSGSEFFSANDMNDDAMSKDNFMKIYWAYRRHLDGQRH